MIENPNPTQRALLVWQRPLGGNEPRPRRRVGEISQHNGRMTFRYLDDEELEIPRREGFTEYPGLPLDFPHLDRIAPSVLAYRLPPRKREDFNEFLGRFGLPPDNAESPYSDLTLLAYTGARLTHDSFSICETFDGFEAPFTYMFDVEGYRHHRSDCSKGDTLTFEREPDNEQDPNAVRVVRADGDTVGYVNRLQAAKVGRWLDESEISASVFHVNGCIEYPRLFARAEITP